MHGVTAQFLLVYQYTQLEQSILRSVKGTQTLPYPPNHTSAENDEDLGLFYRNESVLTAC